MYILKIHLTFFNERIYNLISNEMRFGETNECRGSACPALTDFCKDKKRASLIFDTNWHALCNSVECESLPRFPISPPVRSISDIKTNPTCKLKPFYMQKDMPPLNMWHECYTNGGEMKKEADGAWTLHFKGTRANCSAQIQRVELNNWSENGLGIFSIWSFSMTRTNNFCRSLLSWKE